MENAVVYARYSSTNQTDQSIEGQISAAHSYAEAHGYRIVHEYCDRAKTGTNDNREAFQQMLSDCEKRQFTVIIVWKVDRFGRNREEITFNKYRAKKCGVRVEYVAENITDSPEGVILEAVLEGMAEYFSKQLSQNVKRGMLESAKKHKKVGTPHMLGYKKGANGYFEIDPETAPTVQLIFDKYESGLSMFELMNWLNSHGYKTARGGQFDKSSIPRILKNEKYTGVYIYKDVIREEGAMPAIISREQFDRVQELLNINRRAPSHQWSTSEYLLTGKLICGYCGAFMVGKSGHGCSGRKYNYYVCPNQIHGHKCERKPIRQEEIESIVLQRAYQVLSDPGLLDTLIDLILEYQERESGRKEEKAHLEQRYVEVNLAIGNLVASVEKGLDFDLVKDRLSVLQAEKDTIKTEITQIDLENELKITREQISAFLNKFLAGTISDLDSNKQIVNDLVNSVIADDEISISLNYRSSAPVRIPPPIVRSNIRMRITVYRDTVFIKF